MTLLSRLASLWRNLAHRAERERELDDEVRAYAALLEDEMAESGLPREEARRRAAIATGGAEQVKEEVREARAGALLETTWRDARHGLRTLARTPGFTAAAVVALALGIGATTAIFSVVDAVLVRPLAYRDPARLAVVLHGGRSPVAPANFLDWRREARSFEAMGAADYWQANLSGIDTPERVTGLHVTASLLPMLGVAPEIGRLPAPDEDLPGREHVVVLGHRLWQRRFGADPAVVGRSVRLDGVPHTVVGVMPAGFQFPPFWARGAELWAPMSLADRAENRTGQSLRVFGRLAPGVTLAQARAEIAGLTARLEQAHPGTNRDVRVRPLDEVVTGEVRPALLVLLGAVGLVLLIACANVAHMLLARAAARHKEVALRVALGASRGRMVRQLLTESVVLAAIGGTAGVALAAAAVRAVVAFGPRDIPRLETVTLDLAVLAVAASISLLTGITFGLVPALQASRTDLTTSLREGERGSTAGAGRHRVRRLLMASEMALALVLLVGAGLMIRTFVALRGLDPGFSPDHVLSAVVSVTGSASAATGRRTAFYQDVIDRVRALPGVAAAGAINHLPLAGDLWGFPFRVEGRPRPAPGEAPHAAYRVVLPGYFATMRLPLLRGRDFTERDVQGAPGAVIVNEWMARRYWPGQEALGRRITLDDLDQDPQWLTVVGVAHDAVREDWSAPPDDEIYLPLLQTRSYLESPESPFTYLTLVARTTGEPAALVPALRAAVGAADAHATVSEVQTMDEVVARATASPRFYLLLLASFAAVAVVLAAVGIYGVTSYSVSQRRGEIGIRMALGARPADVMRLVLRESVGVAAAGAAAGLLAALGLGRVMTSLLYGVRAADPLTFAAVCAVLALVALGATYVPARRAVGVDPLSALRSE